jgi:large subunit ribosomal protein L25
MQIAAKKRSVVGKKVRLVREAGSIPAVLYGNGIENQNLEVPYVIFEKLYKTAGESTLLDLVIEDGSPVKVLITGVTHDPVKQSIAHIDFKQINMKEKITVPVDINLIGEAPIIKAEGGSLVTNFDQIEIRCLPTDLIQSIEVDISGLNTYDDVITVADLKIPGNVEISDHDMEDVVVMVAPAEVEEEPVIETAVEEAAPETPADTTEESPKE